jgi:DNA-binding Lrp family transcriptional regulator
MPAKLKNIDLKIIQELLLDGRQSYAEIARKHNTTKETVRNHYQSMKKAGTILGSTVRNSNLVYDRKLMVFFIVQIQSQKLSFVTEKISKIPQVIASMKFLVKQRAIVLAKLADYNELNKVQIQIRELPFVERVNTEILTAVKTTPHNLSIFGDRGDICQKRTGEPKHNKEITIDETDKQIIEKLAINGRTPFSKIAKEISLSVDSVIKRYKRLIAGNVIRVTVQINPSMLGYSAFAFFSLSFLKNELIESLKYIERIKNINLMIQSIGKHDLYLYIMIKDMNEFLEEQNQLMEIPGITNAECDIIKLGGIWPPREIFIDSPIF